MMKIDPAEHARMSESGSSLLRLIQNNAAPTLDLLVREGIANSLDAADQNETHESVDVHLYCDTFETKQLAEHFEGIQEQLNSRYPGNECFLALRDCNTAGLTGPIRHSDVRNDDFGNLLKLVYDISKPQTQQGSGGSWGLGKTIYFRLGAGLVIYYSRIFNTTTHTYETRLAAALVEDETKEPLLPESGQIHRGIAWWGDPDSTTEGKTTIPLINSEETDEILSVFHLPPYKEEETGTTVIIPFLDEEKLLSEITVYSKNKDNTVSSRSAASISEYLKLAVQKWYAPRLNNKHYAYGKYLRVFINEECLNQSDLEPFFTLIQKLYNSTPSRPEFFSGKRIITKKLQILNVFQKSSIAGWISFCRVNTSDLNLIKDHSHTLYRYLGTEPTELSHPPIIAFTRSLGMIVNYETAGAWTNGIPEPEADTYIIGLFVPNSKNILQSTGLPLEEYLRGCENADHMSWHDPIQKDQNGKRCDIIRKLQKHTAKKIRDQYPPEKPVTAPASDLEIGRLLKEVTMPQEEPREKSEKTAPVTKGKNTIPSPIAKRSGSIPYSMKLLEEPAVRSGSVSLHVLLSFGSRRGGILEARVASACGELSEDAWDERIKTPFPVFIKTIHVQKISEGKKELRSVFTGNEPIYQSRTLSELVFEFSSRSQPSSVSISHDRKGTYLLDCTVECVITDKNMTASLRFLPLEEQS